jgi:rRNA processing protein Gar1
MGLISQISKVIEKMNIEGKVKKVVGQVKEMFLKVRIQTKQPGFAKICDRLETKQ